ncbi:calreticulin-like [Dioscorea cayenensis subsp. rotundata]|uniref:Calreticulin-like n=1 Tax=Dioscorea cayennensis subsp. rotundata TaxID=55577 RepID=A0AB40D5F5_DIOCR|nr:calreticulin-like [Dioscorea cayenensis subsp. rotundata]
MTALLSTQFEHKCCPDELEMHGLSLFTPYLYLSSFGVDEVFLLRAQWEIYCDMVITFTLSISEEMPTLRDLMGGVKIVFSINFLVIYFFFATSSEVFFEEHFDDEWEDQWVVFNWRKQDYMAGEWNHTSSKWSGDYENKGIQITMDYQFYTILAELPEFSNKEKTLVFQISTKHEQKINCGGGYMKFISEEINQKKFDS